MDNEDACRLPTQSRDDEVAAVKRMLAGRRIAVVGMSDDPYRPSHGVGSYLQAAGYEVLPVNPNHETVMGLRSYPSLADVPGPIDVVDVFRRSEAAGAFADEAVAIGAKGVWLQLGVVDEAAFERTLAAGVPMVMDTCPAIEWRKRGR